MNNKNRFSTDKYSTKRNSLNSIDEFEENKHVQFSQKITVVNNQPSNYFPKTRTKSFSTQNSSSVTSSRRSSSIISSSSLEYNSSLEKFHRENLDNIRQLIPDEFEKLIPILIKLGVLVLPRKFFENNDQQLTIKELIERHHLFILMKIYEENLQHKTNLEYLYGSVLSDNQLLRESLSFDGQLALIHAYQDQIERELNQKILSWKTSSFRKKSLQNNSSIKSNEHFLVKIDRNLFKEYFQPKQFDQQWQRKIIPFIIEQGFSLLDQIRSLPSNILSNDDINKINLVKAFKQWTFLWSNLYKKQNFSI